MFKTLFVAPCSMPKPGEMGLPVSDVQLVHRVELKLDLLPGLHRRRQFRTAFGRHPQDVAALLLQFTTLVTSLYTGLQRYPVGRCPGGIAPRMTQRTAAELQHPIIAENGY